MLTPWGDLPVRDAHVHFFSQTFFASLAVQSGRPLAQLGALLGWEIPPEDPRALADRWALELDRHGVERASIIASLHGDAESVAAALVHSPGRFHGYFMLDPTAEDAAEHLHGALAWGLRGICLFPAMHRYPLDDGRLRPVFEAAAATPRALVFVHCGVLTVGVRKKLGLASPFDMRFSNPIDLHAIALRYPGLSFVIPHFGAGYFREALMVADLCPNVHLDTSSGNGWTRYQAEPLDLPAVFRRALDVAGPERLLFGTDSSFFPRGWNRDIFERQSRVLSEIGISARDAGLIFGGNLQRLLEGDQSR